MQYESERIESSLDGLLNLERSPNSERITAAEATPIPGIVSMGGARPRTQSLICSSISSTLLWSWS